MAHKKRTSIGPVNFIYYLWKDAEFHAVLLSMGGKRRSVRVGQVLKLFTDIIVDNPKLQHNIYTECIAINYEQLRDTLLRDQALDFNKNKHPLNKYITLEISGNNQTKYCNGYKLTTEGEELKKRIKSKIISLKSSCLHKYNRLCRETGEIFSSITPGLAVPAKYELLLPCRITTEAIEDKDVELFTLIHSNYYSEGSFKQYYKRAANGRLYAQGITLQTVKREMRKKITAGQYSIDIDCSAPTILYALYLRNNTETLPEVERYTQDRRKVRQEIAEFLEVSTDTVKAILMPLFFGGGHIYPNCEIVGELSLVEDISPSEAYGMLCKLMEYTAYKELTEQIKILFDKSNVSGITEQDIELEDKDKLNKRKIQNKKVAYLYQSFEAKILHDILDMNYDKSRKIRDITSLLLHDGIITTHKLDAENISSEIENKHDLKLTFTTTKN